MLALYVSSHCSLRAMETAAAQGPIRVRRGIRVPREIRVRKEIQDLKVFLAWQGRKAFRVQRARKAFRARLDPLDRRALKVQSG